MQRKPTSKTRGPNAAEKAHMGWVKMRPCCTCGSPGPSVVNHCEGATFRHNKILIGHWFVIPLCADCDAVITQGSRKAFRAAFGSQASHWLRLITKYACQPPADVINAIRDLSK